MTLRLKTVAEFKEELVEESITLIGTIEYQRGRQYPWYACHGSICTYFATKSEAVEFARTGEIK
jgi:hypothetical protein|nr:MAG TPA: hypothetical protein [Caudoviricetes sp.]